MEEETYQSPDEKGAEEETDPGIDRDVPNAIRFPRFNRPNDLIPLVFYKTSIYKKGSTVSVNLQPQTVKGDNGVEVSIPKDTNITVVNALILSEFSHRPLIHMEARKLEAFLRGFVLEAMKNKKR